MWLTVNGAGKDVAKITPAGAVTEYELEAITASGIAVGPEGRIWITRNGSVITFDPADPEGSKKTTDIAEIGTAHSIARGPDGNMWVATNGKVLRIQSGDPTKVAAVPGRQTSIPKTSTPPGRCSPSRTPAANRRIVTLTTSGSVDGIQTPRRLAGRRRRPERPDRLLPADAKPPSRSA